MDQNKLVEKLLAAARRIGYAKSTADWIAASPEVASVIKEVEIAHKIDKRNKTIDNILKINAIFDIPIIKTIINGEFHNDSNTIC